MNLRHLKLSRKNFIMEAGVKGEMGGRWGWVTGRR